MKFVVTSVFFVLLCSVSMGQIQAPQTPEFGNCPLLEGNYACPSRRGAVSFWLGQGLENGVGSTVIFNLGDSLHKWIRADGKGHHLVTKDHLTTNYVAYCSSKHGSLVLHLHESTVDQQTGAFSSYVSTYSRDAIGNLLIESMAGYPQPARIRCSPMK